VATERVWVGGLGGGHTYSADGAIAGPDQTNGNAKMKEVVRKDEAGLLWQNAAGRRPAANGQRGLICVRNDQKREEEIGAREQSEGVRMQ
jgi:hypothetical protein